MAKTKRKQTTLKRYRGLIISIMLFIVLIISILGLNIYSSYQTDRNTTQINAANQAVYFIQSIAKDLYNSRLTYGDDPNSPLQLAIYKNLKDRKEKFSSLINAFENGGRTAIGETEQTVFLHALKGGENRKYLSNIKNKWLSLQALLDDYLATAKRIDSDATNLDLAIEDAQTSSIVIHRDASALAENISLASRSQNKRLQYVQYIGIALAVAYFIIFIMIFIRQLISTDRQLLRANRETQEIMSTINEGLFLIDDDLRIGSQYSSHLETIIGRKDIAGSSLPALLEQLVTEADLETTKSFIAQLYNPRVKEKLITDLNPLHRIKVLIRDLSGDEQYRYLDFKFNRVYQEEDKKKLHNILVTVNDITSTVLLEEKLKQEQEQSDQQIQMLSTILNIEPQMLNNFMRKVYRTTENINGVLKDPGKSRMNLRGKLKDIAREVHNLKGESSALNLDSFVSICESFEDKIKLLQIKTDITGDDFLSLTVQLEDLLKFTHMIENINDRMLHYQGQIPAKKNQSPDKALEDFFTNFVSDIAQRNGKNVELDYNYKFENFDSDTRETIKEIAVQLIRNAIVHGIEKPLERREKGKVEKGRIKFYCQPTTEHSARLVIEDDGNGIDFDAIRRKALSMKLANKQEIMQWDKRKLLSLIFDSGFSTAQVAGEDAGRGVGMDVIRHRIKQLGGKMNIQSSPEQFTKFIIDFPC